MYPVTLRDLKPIPAPTQVSALASNADTRCAFPGGWRPRQASLWQLSIRTKLVRPVCEDLTESLVGGLLCPSWGSHLPATKVNMFGMMPGSLVAMPFTGVKATPHAFHADANGG
jgi:hypothetical protein